MEITKIEVFLTQADWRNFLFVKLTTDSGLVGWGDGTFEWKESTVRDLILDLGRASDYLVKILWCVRAQASALRGAASEGMKRKGGDLLPESSVPTARDLRAANRAASRSSQVIFLHQVTITFD